jgi:dTDP-4-dehydrorhamnose reductase
MNKILVLGKDGMLGTMVSKYFTSLNEYEVYLTSRRDDFTVFNDNVRKFDVSKDPLEILINEINPDFLINCIGIIKPEINEDNKESIEKAININTYFPLEISQLSKNMNFKYIQIGTDCVFSGEVGDYLEDASQDANDIYGKTKIGGETEHADKYILRGSIVGPESGDGKSLLNWFLSQNSNKVNGFSDHMWNGITTLNFAKIVHGMIKNNNFNIHTQHVVPKDEVSKYDLLIYFKKYFEVDVIIEKSNSSNSVNRSLKTNNQDENIKLWKDAGYSSVPSIEENIKELSESHLTKGILNNI